MMWRIMLQLLAIISVESGTLGVDGVTRDATDEEYAQFPRLFHLDEYDSCMLHPDALYCLGVFDIVPDDTPRYRLLKEYSDDVKNFNRTRIHRGYCVSLRCPLPRTDSCSTYSNQSHCHSNRRSLVTNGQRFESCVSRWSKTNNFKVQLRALQYCHTKQDVVEEWKVETPHLVFLGVVGLLVVMNIVGTWYDVVKDGEKSKILTAWSMRSNWRHLMGDFRAGDPRTATGLPMEAVRFILILLTIYTHAGCIHDMLYLGNPRLVDQMSHEPIMKLIYNGHSVMQAFILFTSFLLAKKILKEPRPPSYRRLANMLAKRIIRITPVYLLVVGYAATWWGATGSGPQWAPLVAAESAVCRDKFWPLAFFLENYIRGDHICLIATWYLQVDMQLYVAGLVVTRVLHGVRRARALQLLGTSFLLWLLVTAVLAYVRHWAPIVITVGPEMIRASFSNSEVFTSFCSQPVANIGAFLVGLFLAFLLADLKERGFRSSEHKWVMAACQLAVLAPVLWTGGAGQLCRDMSSREALAAFLALERPVMTLLWGFIMFGLYGNSNIEKGTPFTPSEGKTKAKGLLMRIFSCRVLHALGRTSLAVTMLHWCVNLSIAASRHTLYHTSALHMVVDFLATACLSYLAAIPVTLMVDIPAQRTFDALTHSSLKELKRN